MTTPNLPPRPSVGRSSFAIAMKDYTFIRPGIAVTISAGTLLAALFIGLLLIRSLGHAARTVETGATAVMTLHRFNAGLEVWRDMATSNDPAYRRPEAVAQRDSIRRTLQDQLVRLTRTLPDSGDQELVRTVLAGLGSTDPATSTAARQAMVVLLAHQDAKMFQAAETSQEAVYYASILLACAVLAAVTLVVPMAYLYVRFKRGATIEVKV